MRYKYFIITLLLCIISTTAAYSGTGVEAVLVRLDSFVLHKKHFEGEKYAKINKAKKLLEQATTPSARYKQLITLGDEYTLFKADSAILYYNGATEAAVAMGDSLKMHYSVIKKIRPEMIAGFYAEANDEFRWLESSHVDPSLISDFYECGYRLHSFAMISLDESGFFYDKYSKRAEEYRRKWIESLPQDSVLRRLYEAENAISQGKTTLAKTLLGDILSTLKENTNEYALACAFMAKVYKSENRRDDCMRYYAMSAISDIQCAVKENQSLYDLSMLLYEQGDIDRAYRYIFSSLEDAAFCNAQTRVYNASGMLPVIEASQRAEVEAHERMLLSYIFICCILLLGLGVTVFLLMKQMKKLSAARQKLKEANMTKDEYMGQFLDLCSIYMKRLDSFTKMVNRKLSSGQVDDLVKTIKSQKFSDEQHGKFYNEFDNAFLKIYTTFVDEINALLRPEERFELENPNSLTAELRIYALLRLGIVDSSKIAEFLRYSVNTIYAYRNKMKNKAINRDTFEADVMKIGHIE